VQPYGFIERFQSINPNASKAAAVAEQVFQSICKNPKTKPQMVNVLVRTISSSSDPGDASFKVQKLAEIDDGGMHSDWERLRENLIANPVLSESDIFIALVNDILPSKEIEPIIDREENPFDQDLGDEIPF
jgi:hypothetical protein